MRFAYTQRITDGMQDVSKEELLGALSEAHDDLLIAADVAVTLGDTRHHGWGVREVLAHIAGWEAEATRRLPVLIAGEPAQEYDVDAFNAAVVAAYEERTLHQVRDSLEDAHSSLITLLDGLDGAVFAPDGAVHEWVTALARHSREHARELRGAAARRDETE